MARAVPAPAQVERVTPRERDVLRCSSEGLSIKQTALKLHIAEATVVKVRAQIRTRSHAATYVQAVYWYGRGELR